MKVKLLLNAFSSILLLLLVESANWAQYAGKRVQNVVTPYIPQEFYSDASSASRPMWTPRWGHSIVVINQTSMYRNDQSIEENSYRVNNLVPKVMLLGGDDYVDGRYIHGSNGGFRNDIWYSEMTSKSVASWITSRRSKLHDRNSDHFSSVRSNLFWHQSNPGFTPPTTWPYGPKQGEVMTYDEWIVCQEYYDKSRPASIVCDDPEPICYDNVTAPGCHLESTFKRNNMWSPRRGHATVVANGFMYVIGGRARELVPDNDERIIAGSVHEIAIEKESTFREQVVLKNDIWMSPDDGKTWKLITPGCKDQQEDILLKTEFWSGNQTKSSIAGSAGAKCKTSADCYGDAICKTVQKNEASICVCPMFGPREHHSVVVQHRHLKREDNTTFSQDYMYLIGGFTTVRQKFCGNFSCGSQTTYRTSVGDVWVSSDGSSWVQLKSALGRQGFRTRGSHTSLLLHYNPFTEHTSKDRLFIFGGETNHVNVDHSEHLNDIWMVNLTSTPCCHHHGNCDLSAPLLTKDIDVCLPSFSSWSQISANASWRGRSGHVSIHEPPSALNQFTDKIYIMGGKAIDMVFSDVWLWDLNFTGDWKKDFDLDHDINIDSNIGRNHLNKYHDAGSHLSDLKRSFLPLPNYLRGDTTNFYSYHNILSDEEVNYLSSLGVITFSDLSKAGLQTILKLRGYDFPGLETRNISHICYVKSLVTAVISKCEANSTQGFLKESYPCRQGDEKCIVHHWDGCLPLPKYSMIDVHGLGLVSVPVIEEDPLSDLEEIYCKQTPGPRYFSAGVFVDGRILLMGGKGSDLKSLYQDVWSRDDMIPQSSMKVKPTSYSTQSNFVFDSDEDGASQFEYKLVDSVERLDVTPWTLATSYDKIDVSWLDTKKGGPGSGWYTMYVRAIDTSGNRDIGFILGRNVYTWYYLQPLPWNLISLIIIITVICLSAMYIQYRKKVRKAALERFAQRQMKQKFKLHAFSEAGQGNRKDYNRVQGMQNISQQPNNNCKGKESIEYQSQSTNRQEIHGRARERESNESWKKHRRTRRKQRRDAIYRQYNAHSSEDDDQSSLGSDAIDNRLAQKKNSKQKNQW